jgi:GMP synthase (glutamine-hydrolysing)
MPTAVVIQHVPHEGCGRLAGLLAGAGLELRDCLLHQGAGLPGPLQDDLWVVMGGPMGVGDIGDPRYPFLAREAAAIAERLRARRPVLGICLGAQLIAHAAGARVYANATTAADGTIGPVLEVGWGPVRFHDRDGEPALSGLREEEPVLHWHGDTFDLPAGAVHLASTPRCRHQAFRIGQHAYGVQFHPEVEAATVPVWVQEDQAYVLRALGPDGPARILADTARLAGAAADPGGRLLAGILAAMGFPAAAPGALRRGLPA